MIQLKRSIYQVSRICLMNGTQEVADIPVSLDLAVLVNNSDLQSTTTFNPDTIYLDIKNLDALILNLSKYKLPTIDED